MRVLTNDMWQAGQVRVRASAPDPFEGARGHDYIAARNMDTRVERLNLPSYRCRVRPYNQACEVDPALDTVVQVKAANAIDAARGASLVSGCTVVDVERLD